MMQTLLLKKLSESRNWADTESKVNFDLEYKLASFFSANQVPQHCKASLDSGILNNKFIAVRASAVIDGKVESLQQVVEDDGLLHVLHPKFITKWKTIWQDKNNALIRHVQLGNFLPAFNLLCIDAYGVAISAHNPKNGEYNWYISMLSNEELKLVAQDDKSNSSLKENKLSNNVKWINANVPVVWCQAKQLTATQMECKMYLLCNLDYVPFAMYRDIVVASIARALSNLSTFTFSELAKQQN